MGIHRLWFALAPVILLAVAPEVAAVPVSGTPTQQETIYIEPLFEYPVAPEGLEGLTQRCDWLVQHFWEPLDTKSKKTVSQTALNHAFGVYATCLDWATPEVIDKSTSNLISNLSKNPALLIQMIKAAEENLYGPRAAVWRDDVFVRWLRAGVACKKIDAARRERYAGMLKRLEASMLGQPAPMFEFEKPDGTPGRFFPMSTPTILFFGDPDCIDCSRERLRLETDVTLSRLVDQGRVNVLYIVSSEDSPSWRTKVSGIPSNWTAGAAEADEIYDLRTTPAIYVIDKEGKIAAKLIQSREAVALVSEILNPNTQ